MPDPTYLDWPFFAPSHRSLAGEVDAFARANLADLEHHGPVEDICRRLVRELGRAGLLRHTVPAAYGGLSDRLDVRSLCMVRERLAYADGLADFSFVMQGLGTGAISLFGNEETKRKYLPPVARGEKIAALAMSETDAGSDVAAIATTARRDGDHYVIDGEKTWISNGAIADQFVAIVRTGEGDGAKGLSAMVVDADSPGFTVKERIEVIAPHPLATLRFENCRVPVGNLLGEPGQGFKVAMSNLDIFRSTVGAAALGFARRALDEALARVAVRKVFGQKLADFQMTQAKIADMATEIDAAALLVYRAAWVKDSGAPRVTREASMAKMYATEMAQRVVDQAVQLFGGLGVASGQMVERLYREVRALRIYEGTTEVNKLVIAGQVMQVQRTDLPPRA
ncbi:MAG: acyl-CoA dehydrogenase family protein [Alphaproteobacteria bacterium]|nr:acyl-CoA dehydrogenase family protein [Alphaproteobacteria bacterium]